MSIEKCVASYQGPSDLNKVIVLYQDQEVSPTGRSRGTGPRATATGRFLHTRGGQAPALRYREGFLAAERPPLTVGRGPVPRHAPVYQIPLLGP